MFRFENTKEEMGLMNIFSLYGTLSHTFKKGKYIIHKKYYKSGSGKYTTRASSGYFEIEKIEKITEKTVNGYPKRNCVCITKNCANKINEVKDAINHLMTY